MGVGSDRQRLHHTVGRSTYNFESTSTSAAVIYAAENEYLDILEFWNHQYRSERHLTLSHVVSELIKHGVSRNATIGARRGGNLGQLPPTPNLKMMTSYAVSVQNTIKFSLAPPALASNNSKLNLKRRKIRKNFRCAESAPKNRSFLSVHAVLPPSGKISAGAHVDLFCF